MAKIVFSKYHIFCIAKYLGAGTGFFRPFNRIYKNIPFLDVACQKQNKAEIDEI